MKKITSLLVVSFLAMMFAPMMTSAAGISTTLTRDAGGGAAPIIKAKWEMNGPFASLLGTDDDVAAGAQFKAPGVYQANKNYSICAVVTDPDGMADINAVYTDIYYPTGIYMHDNTAIADPANGGTDQIPDTDGIGACGLQKGDENLLTKLSKNDGYNLFCNTIKNNNTNLPKFFTVGSVTYDYNEICATTGELMKETAFVYCADKQLYYEDPAGSYKVAVFALDNAGVFSNIAENQFTYLPLTAYTVDFTSISYGSVKLNTHKRISGDLTYGTADKPTVRNLGNTRLYMGITQDDMKLGTTDGNWNVQYDARVGSNETDWKFYSPNQQTWLEDIVDLSEDEEMDFSILVKKYPFAYPTFTGTMTLDAKFANFRKCTT